MPDTTLFVAIGGLSGITALAHAWHHNVMADEVVSHAFQHVFHPQHEEWSPHSGVAAGSVNHFTGVRIFFCS